MNKLLNELEAILFVSGNGLEKNYIAESLNITLKELEKAIENLKNKYSGECGIRLIQYKDKIQFASNPEYSTTVETLLNPVKEKALSKATLETVAIIAYKQPITRLEIEQIRGVNSDYAIQVLMEHKIIDVVGRKDAVGKPLLFGTTDEFLKRFNLNSLEDLPDYDQLLERIEVIENNVSLYTFGLNEQEENEDSAGEEELPDFLQGEENIQTIVNE